MYNLYNFQLYTTRSLSLSEETPFVLYGIVIRADTP